MAISINTFKEIIKSVVPEVVFRIHQEDTIIKILDAYANQKKKIVILNGPTGSGKSLIAYVVAKVLNTIYGSDSLFITKTIALQNQYLESFSDMRKLMGASNYICSTNVTMPIPSAHKHHESCKYRKTDNKCEYNRAKLEYYTSPMKNLNYAFFMHGMSIYQTKGFMVCDEAHNLEEAILDIVEFEVDIHRYKNEDFGNAKLSQYWEYRDNFVYITHHDAECLIQFLARKLAELAHTVEELEKSIEDNALAGAKNIISIIEESINPLKKKIGYYAKAITGLRMLATSPIEHWVQHHEKDDDNKNDHGRIIIKPLFVPRNIHKFIFEVPRQVLLMSATAARVQKSLQLNDDEVSYIDVPYSFSLENRPVYALTSLPKFNYETRNTVLPTYVEMIDELIDSYDDNTNVLIHTISYSNSEFIKEHSKHSKRILIPSSHDIRNIQGVIVPGMILVSPAVTEGIDLAGGMAAVQIFLKVPYPSLQSEFVNRKKDADEGWYDYKAMVDIIQGSGRGIRGPQDKADTFILDPSFHRLVKRVGDLIPEWWLSTVNYI